MLPIFIYLVFSMVLVLYFDITRYIIPNWLVGSLLFLYPAAVWLSPMAIDWQMACVAALGVFFVGYIMFVLKWMGGGDVKLIAVCSLWVGLKYLPDFIFMFALLGGVLSLLVLLLRKILPLVPHMPSPLPKILRVGEPIPYGVAIAIGFFIMLMMEKVPAAAYH